MMVSFCVVVFLPRDVLDEILDLIESVSGGPTYSCCCAPIFFVIRCANTSRVPFYFGSVSCFLVHRVGLNYHDIIDFQRVL